MRTMTDEERAAAIARVVFLMPGLTAAGLHAVRETAEFWARREPRDLSSGTLAAEQATRHGLLADADATLSKARRERTHGASCDCGACTAQTTAMQTHEAARRCACCGGAYGVSYEGTPDNPPRCEECDAINTGAPTADLHDTASDAAAVIGAASLVGDSCVFCRGRACAHIRPTMTRGQVKPDPRVGGWSDPIIEGIRASERGSE